jgi:CMP-N-acetylneuraminic acid synthetase
MYKNKRILAIIPARKGSKRIPGKNKVDLNGIPLIEWTIKAAIDSCFIDKVIISTDDRDIVEIASRLGVPPPFTRPGHLSSDSSSRYDVIKHTLDYISDNENNIYDFIMYLQPTSPCRNSMHIDNSIEYLHEKKADAIVSVSKVGHPINWTTTLPEDSSLENYTDNLDASARSQDYSDAYIPNGAIFLCSVEMFKKYKCMYIKENICVYYVT